MNKVLSIFSFVLLIITAACNTDKIMGEKNFQFYKITWGETSNGLQCSIDTENLTLFSPLKTPLSISVVIENVSNGRIDLKTIPAFELKNDEMVYWCPVDIIEEKHLPANHRSLISLEKGSSIISEIDISKLGWDYASSSIWPQKSFYDLIGQGNYKVRLNIEITEGSDPDWVFSNELNIAIIDWSL